MTDVMVGDDRRYWYGLVRVAYGGAVPSHSAIASVRLVRTVLSAKTAIEQRPT
ncbi:MAG: hypothetical protein AAF810_17660 [Cyanobacteria bacterium P01_D01_bin.36]